MRLETPRDLFVYELGVTRSLERMGDRMFSEIGQNISNREITRILHQEEQYRRKQAENIDACLHSLGLTPLEHRSSFVEALRERFFEFARLRPSPAALDLYVLGTALRFSHLVNLSYRDLVDLADRAGEPECHRRLQDNLTHKEQYTARLEQYNDELRTSTSLVSPR